MTAKNSFLLIIKQFPGIEYNVLLSKISSNYGSVNSARAALSRALKDMNALSWIEKRSNKWFATEKGQTVLNSEMKNKLLFRLNQSVQSKNRAQEIDAIVEQLSVLIERSKNDADLLKAAKNAVRFSIQDLSVLSDEVNARLEQTRYWSEVFQKQIESLRELDFNDSRILTENENPISFVQSLVEKNKPEELFVSGDAAFIGQLGAHLGEKTAHENAVVLARHFEAFFAFLRAKTEKQEVLLLSSVSFAPFTVRFSPVHTTVSAPHSKLKEL